MGISRHGSRGLARRPRRPLRSVLAAVALTALAGVLTAPPDAAAAATNPAPGLVQPAPVPQRADYTGPLASASEAVAGPDSSDSPSGSTAGDPGVPAADATAAAQAKATGKPVVVPSLTTETSEVLAQPDGEFEMVSSTLPSRVKSGGKWQPISTVLRAGKDGTWSAPLTAGPVTFSGGGRGPLVTVTDPASGRQMAVSWPYRLPAPSVSGSVALYRDVLPGTDLRLRATATGYQDVLIVHNAAAAADPRLKSLRFTLRGGSGVTVREGPAGAVTAVDSKTRKTLFTSGQPMMWDSAPGHRAPAASAGHGEVLQVPSRRALGSQAGRSQAVLTLTPFSAAAAAPGKLRFPLYIDPQINDSSSQYYAEVANFGGSWNNATGTTSVGGGEVQVGYCGYSDCYFTWNGTTYYHYVNRVYFRMNTSALEARNGFTAKVYSATFSPDEVDNSNNCTAQPVALYKAGAISSSTTWGGPQGTELSTASSNAGGGSSCPAAHVALSATSYLQAAADSSWPNTTFELRAPDESNDLQYKVFTKNPTLTVWYNFAPLTPTGLKVGKQVTCTSTVYTSENGPALTATGKDNNPSPLNLDFTYHVLASDGTQLNSYTYTNGGGGFKSGSTVSWTSPKVTSGNSYMFNVQTNNVLPSGDKASERTSPWAGRYSYTVLSSPPSAAPSIQSFDYPAGQWGQPRGAPGIFTVGTSGDANIAGFAYSFDGGSASEPVPDTSDCNYQKQGGLGTSVAGNGTGNSSGELALVNGSTAQIAVPAALTPGRHTLFVRSFDYAHNASPETAYAFYVAPDYQSVTQPVTYIDGESLAGYASGADASLVSTQANCCGISWQGGSQLWFKGTASGQTFTVPLNVPGTGTWQLGAELTKSFNYGQVQIDLDAGTSSAVNLDGTATTPFDGYSSAVTLTRLDLGTRQLTQGTHTLTFTLTGENSASTSYQFGLDFLTLSPTNRYDADSLPYGNNTAGTLQQQCFKSPIFADYCQLRLFNSAAGTSFTVSFDAPVESDYALGVNLTNGTNYGEDKFELDPSTSDIVLDDTADQPIDAYSSTVPTQYVFLGGVHLTKGTHVIKVTVTGANSSSSGYDAGIDFLEAAPVTGAKEASFTAAMNNLGIASDGGTSAGDGFDLRGYNLSLQTLQAAGITPGTASGSGTTFSLNGASFTMPELRADGSGTVLDDNVIPDGQTIPLPAVKATGVALLVSSTCGTSPAAYATLGYGGGQSSNGVIPAVGAWISGPSSDAVIMLDHRDHGTTAVSPGEPRLYEVMLPANPNYSLASITLPVMPVNFLTGTSSCSVSQALHVLAIGTRTVPAGPSGTAWTGAYDGPMDTAVKPDQTLSDQTLREVVPLSAGGSGQARIRLSNAHSNNPVSFDAVTVAAQASGGGAGTVATPQQVQFNGSASVTIPAGGDAYSDAFALPSMSGGSGKLTVSMHIPPDDPVTSASIHESVENLTTYYASGNDTANTGSDFASANSLQGQYYLTGVDVSDATSTDGTVAVLGDQGATAGMPAWQDDNWVTDLPSALNTAGVAVPGSIADASTGDAPPVGWWRMNGTGMDTSSTAYDSGTDATRSLTLVGSPSWSSDNPGTGVSTGSLSLNGTSQYAQAPGPVVTTGSNFAVSAWVKLSSTSSANNVAVSEDGGTGSAFYLGYNAGKWAFWLNDTDTTNPTQTVVDGPTATAGTWTHLAGVYNASLGQVQLYVNGTLAGSASYTPSWSATGDLVVGRSLFDGSQDDFWPGSVSDVRAYNRVMWAYNVSGIYHDTGMSSVTAANAAGAFSDSAFEDYAAGEPGLRDVIVSLGTNDVLQGAPAKTVENSLQALITTLKGTYASDGTGAGLKVVVTTIPPLEMSGSDPREAVREAVNTWLLNDVSPDQVVDVASAVASPSSPNLVSSSYLSNGAPSAAYYTAIADAVATALSGPPPFSL